MNVAAVAPQPTWLTNFDPTDPSSLAGLLKAQNTATAPAAAPKPTWLTNFDPTAPSSLTGLLNAKIADPANGTAPAGFNVLAPASLKPTPPAGPSQFQQALSAFTVTANTFLIQSAINGYQPLAAPAAFGSVSSYYQSVNSSAQTILAAGKAGTYGNVNALA